MRLGDLDLELTVVFFLFLLLSPIAFSTSYLIGEKESGWNTGFRESTTLILDVSGFSMGHGDYSRYGEIGLDDVRVRDRTSSANGTLVYEEGMHVASDDSNGVTFDFTKPPGTQDFNFTVVEAWPVHIDASRVLDFTGKSINDREYFGNNYENTGSSILYATDLRKDTAVVMDLRYVVFNAIMNNTTKELLKDEFMPNLTLLYNHRSSFTGLGSFRTQHSLDRKPAMQDEESYWGTFTVARHINSTSRNWTYPWLGANESYYHNDWLSGCCMSPYELPVYSIPISIEARKNDKFG